MVGDGDAGGEEAREHLAPGAPRLAGLVGDGGIAREIDGEGGVVAANFDAGDGGAGAVELEDEFVVPVEDAGVALAVLEGDAAIRAGDGGGADVDGEGAGLDGGGAGGGLDRLEHQAARLGLDGGVGRAGGIAEEHDDVVVALGQVHHEREWRGADEGIGGEGVAGRRLGDGGRREALAGHEAVAQGGRVGRARIDANVALGEGGRAEVEAQGRVRGEDGGGQEGQGGEQGGAHGIRNERGDTDGISRRFFSPAGRKW